MQSLCTLRDHRRQGSHNTRYQAGAAPYLDRFSTGWIAPACLAHLFDHLVGEGEHPWRNIEAQRLGGLKVDHQLELGRLQHREADSSARSQKMYMYRRASVARAVSCSSRVRRVSADRAICGRSPANAHDQLSRMLGLKARDLGRRLGVVIGPHDMDGAAPCLLQSPQPGVIGTARHTRPFLSPAAQSRCRYRSARRRRMAASHHQTKISRRGGRDDVKAATPPSHRRGPPPTGSPLGRVSPEMGVPTDDWRFMLRSGLLRYQSLLLLGVGGSAHGPGGGHTGDRLISLQGRAQFILAHV